VGGPLHENLPEHSGWLSPLHIGRRLGIWMVPSLAYLGAVTLLVTYYEFPRWTFGKEGAELLGLVLGILIVLRINTAIDRWWEARKLWGQLINDSRNLALKARAHADAGPEEHGQLARLLTGFAHALRLHLRGVTGVHSVPGFESEPTNFPHGPGYIAGLVHRLLDHWNRQGKLRDTVWVLDVHARALMDICGACERIRNTPLSSSFRALVRWGIVLYILIAPWGVALEVGWSGVPVLALGFAFLDGIELTAEEIEEPFGAEKDDLPLDTYCRNIETFVFSVLEVQH